MTHAQTFDLSGPFPHAIPTHDDMQNGLLQSITFYIPHVHHLIFGDPGRDGTGLHIKWLTAVHHIQYTT